MKTLKRTLLSVTASLFALALTFAVCGMIGGATEKKTALAYDAQTDYIDNVGINATINDKVAFDVYLRRTNAVMNQVCMINSDHNKYVGYYKVYLDGSGTNTTGAYSFPNGKGGYTVVLDLTVGPKGGSPTADTVLNCFRKRGDSGNDSNSDFYVENFRLVDDFTAFSITANYGSTYRQEINSLTKGTDNAVAIAYKMDDDDKYVNLGLGNGSNAWFGYYTLYGSVANTSSYTGITLRELDDDWVLAIFDLTALNVTSGSSSNWTDGWPVNAGTPNFNKIMAQKANTAAMTGYYLGSYEDVYTVSVTNGTGGNVYLPDEKATATVTADDAPDGKIFSHWENGSGTSVSTDEEYSFAVTGDISLTAVYADTCTISVTNGTIGGETSATVADGSSATVVANTPASGKYFAYWANVYGKILSYNPTYTFTVDGDTEVTAVYASEDSPKHTFTSGTHLNSSSWLTVTQQPYSTVIFDYYITDNDNSKVISVGILGSSDSQNYYGWTTFSKAGVCNNPAGMTVIALTDGYYRVIVDTTNASIHHQGSLDTVNANGVNYIRIHRSNSSATSAYIRNVQFLNEHTVSVTNGEGADTYTTGTSVTVVAAEADGYYFRNWTDDSDDSVLSTDASYTFTVTEDIALTANLRAYDGTKVAVGEKVNEVLSGSQTDEFTFEYLFEGDDGSAGICLLNSDTSVIGVDYFTIRNASVGSTSTGGVTITREQLSDGYYKVTVSGAAVATTGMNKIYSNSSNKVAGDALWIRNVRFTPKKLVTVENGTISGNSSAYVSENASATVVAGTPASGKYFAYWTDDDGNIVSFTPSYTFTVSADITLTANYATDDHASYTTGGSSNWNSSTVDNIAYDKIIFDYCISDGESTDNIAVAALYDGSNFYGWYYFTKAGGGAETGVTVTALESGYYRVIIDTATATKTRTPAGAYVVQIHRSKGTSGITVYVRNVRFVKNGTVSLTDGTLQNGETSGSFTGTTPVTVTADDAPSGKAFSHWENGSGVSVSTDEEYTFTVVGNISLTAVYANLYTVTVVNGTIDDEESADIRDGDSATVVADEPASTKYFVGWSDGSSIVSTDEEYTFTVTEDVTLTAVYGDKVSVSATGAASGTGLYAPGASATLVANAPASGKCFAYWTNADGNIVSFAPSYTFTVSSAVSFTANYDTRDSGVAFDTDSKRYYADSANAYDYVVFDYKLDGSGSRVFRILNSSSAYSGSFDFGTDYSGKVTCYTLENGWVRVVCNISGFDDYSTKYSGSGDVNAVYVPSNESGETGKITYVRFVKNGTVTVNDGTLQNGATSGSFTGTTPVTVTANDAPSGKVFVCWKDGSDEIVSTDEEYTFAVVGNISLTAVYANLVTVSASGGTVDGKSSETIGDGSIVTLVANAPAAGYYFVNWKNAAGDVVSWSSTVDTEVDGATTYTAYYLEYSGTKYRQSVSTDISAPKGSKAYDRVSFDYRITAADKTLGFALLNDGSTYFGYFTINSSGTASSYEGVATERLSNGYIRVTLDLDDLKTKNNESLDGDSEIYAIHFAGNRAGADYYLENVNFLISNEPFEMYAGASVRLNEPYGIRFRAFIPFDKYDKDATYGMIILPYDYIEDNDIDLSDDIIAQLDAKEIKYRNFTCYPVEMDTTDYYIQASLTNILAKNLTREFVGIGYAIADDEYTYVTEESIGNCKRTITTVATKTMQHTDLFNGYTASRQEFLRNIVGCGGETQYSGSDFKVNAFDSLENFKKNAAVSSSSTLTLYAAKGESESGQVILTDTASGDMEDAIYIVTVGDLTHSDGATKLSKSNIGVFNAHYVNVTSNATAWTASYNKYNSYFPSTGYYPDALVPFSAAATNGDTKFVSTGGYNQAVYFDFDVPLDQKAGVYSGYIRIDVIGYGYKLVPVSFTVMDIELPEENHAKTIFEIGDDYLNAVQGLEGRADNASEDYTELYEFLLDYGVNAGFIPKSQYHSDLEWDDYVAALVHYYKDPSVTTIKLDMERSFVNYSYGGTSYTNLTVVIEYDRNMNNGHVHYGSRTIFKKLAEYCIENDINLFEKIVVRYDDEPESAKEYCQAILSYNAVKRGINYAAYDAGIDWTGHEDILGALLDVPYLVTTANNNLCNVGNSTISKSATAYYATDDYNDSNQNITITYDYLTDFVPLYKFFTNDDGTENSGYSEIYYTIGDDDYTYWWYGCVHPSPPYQNYALNASMVRSRANRWAQFGTGIEGELYWGVNFWGVRSSNSTTYKDEAYIWANDSVYENSFGDGMLVYPNFSTYEGADKYIATIRLYAIRESIDDYNMLWYAQSLIDEMVSGSEKTAYQSTLDGILATLYTQTDSKSAICDTRSVTDSASTLRTARANLYALVSDLLGGA